ncbi:MAG: electron transfer flavoprotein subunit beta/FixA family protein [Desulfatiglandales bacterium]
MDVVVCLRRVPFTQEVDLEIDKGQRQITAENLAFVLNDWDNYALEEAISIKERTKGTVTAITVGTEEDEEVLRRALAMGADTAIRIDSEGLTLDPRNIARLLARVIRGLRFHLILTGAQSDDLNEGCVGPMLAEELGLPHASVVNKIELGEDVLGIKLELEGGIEETSTIRLPCLLTIQTGINEPRYVSVMGIRKAAKKELKVVSIEELSVDKEALVPDVYVERLFYPPEAGGAEILAGDPLTVAEKILRILRERGVIS